LVLLLGLLTPGCWSPPPLEPIPRADYPKAGQSDHADQIVMPGAKPAPAELPAPADTPAPPDPHPPDEFPRPDIPRPKVRPAPDDLPPDAPRPTARPDTLPAKVRETLEYVDRHGQAPDGYQGGRTFHNSANQGEQPLPYRDARGQSIRYREWDVNPKLPGVNRGPERLITGSDGSAYYTRDHYRTFLRIR
jgi:guanyl-specific ribonuclease Sa